MCLNIMASSVRDYFKRPFILSWYATWFILAGSVISLVSSLFFHDQLVTHATVSLIGTVITFLGALLFGASSFINQSILVSASGFLFSLGLSLLTIVAFWHLHDVQGALHTDQFDKFQTNIKQRARLTIGGCAIIMVGMGFAIKKGCEKFVVPYGGPPNYFFYGVCSFAGGAICYLLTGIAVLRGSINVHENGVAFGSFLFVVGAVLLLLSTSRSFYAMDLLVLHNFPTITSWLAHSDQSLVLCLGAGSKMIGFIIAISAAFFAENDGNFAVHCGGTGVATFGSLLIGCTVFELKHFPSSTVLAHLLLVVVYMGYSLSTGLRLHDRYSLGKDVKGGRGDYANDVGTLCTAVGIILSAWLIVVSCKFLHYNELLSVSGFSFLSQFMAFGGFLALFMHEVSLEDDPEKLCSIACAGTEQLGLILLFLSALLEFLFFNVMLDIAVIDQGGYKAAKKALFRFFFCKKERKRDHLSADSDYTAVTSGDEFSSDTQAETNRPKEQVPDNPNMRKHVKALIAEAKAAGLPSPLEDTDVIIAGCGPAGLSLANEVGCRAGTRVIACDPRTSIVPDSRFFNLFGPSVESLKRIGAMDHIFEKSVPEDFKYGAISLTGLTHPDAQIFASAVGPSRKTQLELGYDMPDHEGSIGLGSKWAAEPPQRAMQSTQEEALKEIASGRENISLRYGWQVESFYNTEVSEDGGEEELSNEGFPSKRVIVKILNSYTNEERFIRAKYLVGCDGPSSTVSRILRAKFDGFVNLGETHTTHIHAPGLLEIVRARYGEALQYHIARPGYGVGFFVCNNPGAEVWTFFLIGLSDGTPPKNIKNEQMEEIIRYFLGTEIQFRIISDAGWFWNLFFARQFVFDNVMICGDACHSWPPFGGIGGNCGYGDTQNLGWKLAAMVQGWGNSGLLQSYELERREAGLRHIMAVLNFTPDRRQVVRLADVVQYPAFWWTAKYRWVFSNSGAHGGNHYSSEGLHYGLRYCSSIVSYDIDPRNMPPVESSVSKYTPVIVPGGRLPHLKLPNAQGKVKSVLDLISMEGYTLLVVNCKVTVEDRLTSQRAFEAQHERRNANDNGDGDDIPPEAAVRDLSSYFRQRNIPLTVVRLVGEKGLPQDIRVAGVLDQNTESVGLKTIMSLYKGFQLILVRPDLYITWTLRADEIAISSVVLQKVAQISCAELVEDKQEKRAASVARFYTQRFISNIQGYRTMHNSAIYIENQDKASVINQISQKNKIKLSTVDLNSKPISFSDMASRADSEAFGDTDRHVGENGSTPRTIGTLSVDATPRLDTTSSKSLIDSSNIELLPV